MKTAYVYLLTAIVLLSLDAVYLTLLSGFFDQQIRLIQGSSIQMNFVAAAMCYIILVFGINHFILEPRKSVYEAFLLGIVIYGVYETTSYSLLKNWRFSTVVVDTLWGGTLFALTTWIVGRVR
jgi:uncharacterized membrane protein